MSDDNSTDTHTEADGDWGNVYEGVEYPLSFILTGSGRIGAWNIEDLDPASPADITLTNELVSQPASFVFTRVPVLGGPLPSVPLSNSELVTIEIAVTLPTPLYWTVVSSTADGGLEAIALTRNAAVSYNNRFIFSSSVFARQCIVHINLQPDTGALPVPLPLTTLASLYTDARPIVDWTGGNVFHNIVWPNSIPQAFPPFRKIRLGTALGDWVWKPRRS